MRLVKTYLNSWCKRQLSPKDGLTHLGGEFERRPVVPVLHDLQNITLKLDLSVKEGIVELLHRDLGVLVFAQVRVLQVDVVVERFAGERDLLVEPLAVL